MEFHYDQSQTTTLKYLREKKCSDPNDRVPDSYFEIPGESFRLRSNNYLSKRKKTPSGESAFELVNFTMIKSEHKLWHVSKNLRSLREFLANFPDDFFFVVVRMLPNSPKITAITIARKKNLPEDPAFDRLLEKFIEGSDDFRNSRFKYIAKLENAPWAILTTVKLLGGERPVIMGKGYLDQCHFRGENYFEVDVDVGSHVVARNITSTVTKHCNKFTVSECFVVEGQEEEELPERALFCICMEKIIINEVAFSLTLEDKAFFDKHPFQR